MTLFSKIIAGEIPCYKIYEDEKALASDLAADYIRTDLFGRKQTREQELEKLQSLVQSPRKKGSALKMLTRSSAGRLVIIETSRENSRKWTSVEAKNERTSPAGFLDQNLEPGGIPGGTRAS